MTRQISNKPIDTRVYEDELCPWLPDKIIDCHVHIGIPEHCGPISEKRIQADWAMEVGVQQSWDDWRAANAALLPKQHISALVMGVPFREMYLDRNNDYVISGITDSGTRALFVTRPEWDAEEIDKAFERGFVGIKPYPDFAPESDHEPSIYDFLPKPHMEVLDRRAGILMLHIPRAGRLADPDNIREVLEINDTYPAIKLIVAHVGRSFCLPTAQKGLPHFADRPGICFDIAANLNADVFSYAFNVVGPERILYGSDLPITLMRGIREYVGEKYINFTDGAYSWNTNRKPPEVEATYTYFLYEQLRALIKAAKHREIIQQVMFSNMAGLLNH